jgi:biuret amidohydrolase
MTSDNGEKNALIKNIDETALLIIDMQMYQAGEGGNLPRYFGVVHGPETENAAVKRGEEVVTVIRSLLDSFRSIGAFVVYTAFGSLSRDGSDLVPYVRLWNSRCREKLGFPAIVPVSDPGYVMVPDLAPLPNEPVVNKTAQGAFNSSVIDHVLKQRGIKTIIATGMYTNHCVMATCIGAADAGYRVIVPEDAVGSFRKDLHEDALRIMGSWIIRTGSERLLREIRSLTGRE